MGPNRSDRGQAHTVEAFVAALLLIGGLVFAMQATAVTPLSASTSNQHIENQQRAVTAGVLDTSIDDGSLQEAILYWNSTSETFRDTGELGYYTAAGPPNDFGETLNRSLGDRRIAFNVYLRYHREDGSMRTDRMVYMGRPSDNAVTASRSVALYNDTRLTGGNSPTLEAVANDSSAEFYAPNVGDGAFYNRVEVQIVTWRM